MTGNWTRCDTFGLGMKKDASGELIDILLAKVPANTPEGKAELSEALKHPAFNRSACTKIGIAVVTIDWYLNHQEWMDHVTSGDYQNYYQDMYKNK